MSTTETQQRRGHYFLGLLKGVIGRKAGPKDNPDKQWIEHNLVVEDDNFNTVRFRLSKNAIDAKLHDKLDAMAGKVVLCPVFRLIRNTDKGRYETWYYGSDTTPQVVK